MPKHKATCLPNDRRISVDEEENLLQAAMEAGIHINASCGQGVVDSPKHPKLTQWEYDQGFRLACLTPIRDDLDAEIPIESQVDRSVLTLKQDIYQLVKGWDEDPAVFKRYVQLDPPTLKDDVSDLTHLINTLDRQHDVEGISAAFHVNMKLSCLFRESEQGLLLSPN